jgi:hypothetical protein
MARPGTSTKIEGVPPGPGGGPWSSALAAC